LIEEKNAPKFLYAGFWRRFVAGLIDITLIAIVIYGLLFLLIFLGLLNGSQAEIFTMIFGLIILLFPWLYFAQMECSPRQATLGKILLGIIVTDLNGNKINFGKASGRFWAKLIPFALVYITRPVPSDIIGTIAISIFTTLRHPFASFREAPITLILTLIPFIWFGSIAFTAQKQAPHDMMAKCLVLRKSAK
jgi:uncharacterized RDD family membrane protein YckC